MNEKPNVYEGNPYIVLGINDKAVVVNNHKNNSHFDRNEKTLPHLNAHKKNAYRPDVKTTIIKVSRHNSYIRYLQRLHGSKYFNNWI